MTSTRTKAMRWSAVGVGIPAAFLTGALAFGSVGTASADSEVVSTETTSTTSSTPDESTDQSTEEGPDRGADGSAPDGDCSEDADRTDSGS